MLAKMLPDIFEFVKMSKDLTVRPKASYAIMSKVVKISANVKEILRLNVGAIRDGQEGAQKKYINYNSLYPKNTP